MVDYFQIKYLIIESFYYEVCVNNCSYAQAAGICYEEFLEYIKSRGIESIVAESTIIRLKYRHKVSIDTSDINSMKSILEKSKELCEESFLNKESMEFFSEELDFISEMIERQKANSKSKDN